MSYKRINVNFKQEVIEEFQALIKSMGATSLSGYIRYLVDKEMKLIKKKLKENSY